MVGLPPMMIITASLSSKMLRDCVSFLWLVTDGLVPFIVSANGDCEAKHRTWKSQRMSRRERETSVPLNGSAEGSAVTITNSLVRTNFLIVVFGDTTNWDQTIRNCTPLQQIERRSYRLEPKWQRGFGIGVGVRCVEGDGCWFVGRMGLLKATASSQSYTQCLLVVTTLCEGFGRVVM